MKKKLILPLLLTMLCALCTALCACDLFGGNSNTGSGAQLIKVDSAVPEGDEVVFVVDHETWHVYGSIVEVSEGASWKLYYDEACTDEAENSRFAGKNGTLSNGNNIFYIKVISGDERTANTYKLTIHKSFLAMAYYYDGSQFLDSRSFYTGEQFTPTYTPDLVGYTFGGWVDEEDHAFSSGIVWDDINLYLSKTPITYKATLDANGGEAPKERDVFIDYDSDFTLPALERFGYTFAGWYANDTQVTDGTGCALAAWNFTQDTALTARWTPKQFILTLQNDDSTAGYISGAGAWDYGSMASATAYPKDGYTFVGWYDEEDELITRDTEYKFEMVGERTLTAKWGWFTLTVRTDIGGGVSPSYEVKFDLNGGSGTAPDTQHVSKFQGLSYPTELPVREGYLFRGWFTSRWPANGAAPYNFSAEIKEDLTLYAAWYALPQTEKIEMIRVNAPNNSLVNLQGTKSADRVYMYFCVYAADTYTINYYSETTDFGGVSLVVRNETAIEAETIVLEDSYNDQKNHAKTFSVKAGNVYRIELWRGFDDEHDYYFWISLSGGGNKPQEGGLAASFVNGNPVRSGTEFTFVAIADPHCEFLGWYDETGELVSTELILEVTMPYSTKVFTAKWRLIE